MNDKKIDDSITLQQLKSFESMDIVKVNVDKQTTISVKADRDLFQK